MFIKHSFYSVCYGIVPVIYCFALCRWITR